MITRKALYIASPALLGIGIAAASLFGGEREVETTIPAGTTLVPALEQQVSSQRSQVGDAIALRTVAAVRLRDGAEVPRGAVIRGTVTDLSRSGPPQLGIRFTVLEIAGDETDIATEQYRFGTLAARVKPGGRLVLPAGHLLKIRLSRPAAVDYWPAPDQAE